MLKVSLVYQEALDFFLVLYEYNKHNLHSYAILLFHFVKSWVNKALAKVQNDQIALYRAVWLGNTLFDSLAAFF